MRTEEEKTHREKAVMERCGHKLRDCQQSPEAKRNKEGILP